MTEIVGLGSTHGILDFKIHRGEGEPCSSFNVDYFPCDGVEDSRLQSGALINLYLSDPSHSNYYEDIFKGIADVVNEIENDEGISYSIGGRDLAAIMSYQDYNLYGGLSVPNSKAKAGLGYIPTPGSGTHGDVVDLWGEILAIMQNTPLTELKTSLPSGGEMQFHATEWWSYMTDAGEDAPAGLNMADSNTKTENADGMFTYEQGEWHHNHKERIVVTPQVMKKPVALDEILNNAIGIGSHLGKYSWCVDHGGALVIFRVDQPEHIVNFDISMDCVSDIRIADDSTGVLNRCKGHGHNTVVKTTEPASTTRIEADVRNQRSIDRFWQRDAPIVDNPDLNQDELNLTCQNSIDPNPKYPITITLNDYSNFSIATAIRIPNRAKAAGKTFTITDYEIAGRAGDGYTTVLNGEVWGKTVANPSAYQYIKGIAHEEVKKAYSIGPVNVIDVDREAGFVKVLPSGIHQVPMWVRYPRSMY